MRYRTEDLLTILDGGPVDAAVRARALADPAAHAELERLRRVRADLGALPELAPPPMFWARIEAAAGQRPPRRGRRLAAAGAGAAAVLATLAGVYALVAPGAAERAADPAVAPTVRESAPRELAPRAVSPERDVAYRRLVEQSIELERLLARVPEPRPVMRLGTAGTIAGLEEQIALVDVQLALGTAENWEPRYREALWSERVDLMTALVQVRFAQSQSAGF